jgi:hypothetical protein
MIIKWWVDASYAVHPNMRSHTGATITLGKGSVYLLSTKQKLNTRSSTEAELVGVNDAMALILWTRNFLEAQGFDVTDNVVYQDNESAILLENNGRASSSKRTRHIDIRYYFVTDNIQRKRLRVIHCPTEHMVADFFTKPLQGAQFRKLRNEIMNLPHLPAENEAQECVEADRRQAPDKRDDHRHTTGQTLVCDDQETQKQNGKTQKQNTRTYAEVVRGKQQREDKHRALTLLSKPVLAIS